jgi:hypothetical protein
MFNLYQIEETKGVLKDIVGISFYCFKVFDYSWDNSRNTFSWFYFELAG